MDPRAGLNDMEKHGGGGKVFLQNLFGETEEKHDIFIQDSQCPSRDSNLLIRSRKPCRWSHCFSVKLL
jgi:hypothetical protein